MNRFDSMLKSPPTFQNAGVEKEVILSYTNDEVQQGTNLGREAESAGKESREECSHENRTFQ